MQPKLKTHGRIFFSSGKKKYVRIYSTADTDMPLNIILVWTTAKELQKVHDVQNKGLISFNLLKV